VVLEPAFLWSAAGDYSQAMETAMICSNCDHLKLYAGDKLVTEIDPDRTTFGNLPHPPFTVDLRHAPKKDVLRIEGFVAGKQVVEKRFSHLGIDREFEVRPDDSSLRADGGDCTRVVLRVTDEFGNQMRYSTAAIRFSIDGPGEVIGDNPFSLVGGCGAIWVRAKEVPGTVTLKATHPVLGTKQVSIQIEAAEAERV
jgi:beta-galactosidase